MRKRSAVRVFALFLALIFLIPAAAIAIEIEPEIELQEDMGLCAEVELQNTQRVFGVRSHRSYGECGQPIPARYGAGQTGNGLGWGSVGYIVAPTQTLSGYRILRYQSTVSYIFRPIEHFSAYALGDSATTFAPARNITRAEAATMLYRLSGAPDTPGTSHFSDVADGAWYRASVMYLSSRGVILGLPDGTFRPNQIITRAEFSAILTRYAGLDIAAPATAQFPDVVYGAWYHPSVTASADKGWVIGFTDGTFRPANNISRAEAVTMINRMDGRTGVNISADVDNPFTDVPGDHWALGAILSASRWHSCEWHTPEPFARGIEHFHEGTNFEWFEFSDRIHLGLGRTLFPSVEFQADPTMRPDPPGTVSWPIRPFPTSWDFDNPGAGPWPQWGWRFIGLEYEINWLFISDADYAQYSQWIIWP